MKDFFRFTKMVCFSYAEYLDKFHIEEEMILWK